MADVGAGLIAGSAAGDLPGVGGSQSASDGEFERQFAGDVQPLRLIPHVGSNGRLVEFDFGSLPFPIRRVFAITAVPAGTERGGHRHHHGVQILFCLTGRVEVELRRGEVRHELTLTPETGGLCIAGSVWARQRYVEEGSELLVLASEPFDPASYDTSW